MSGLAGQVIDRSRRQQHRRPIETTRPASPETHRRRGAQRDAEDMLEHRPVAVPADPGPRVIADQQGLDEFVRLQAGEPRRLRPKRQQPIRDRLGGCETGIVEVIAPAVGGGQPLAQPAMEPEGRKFRGVRPPRSARAPRSGVTMAPAWDNPARRGSPNRSGWAAIRVILPGSWCRLHPMWAAIGDDPPNTRLLRRSFRPMARSMMQPRRVDRREPPARGSPIARQPRPGDVVAVAWPDRMVRISIRLPRSAVA